MSISVKKAKKIFKAMLNNYGEPEYTKVKWCHRRKLFVFDSWGGQRSLGLMTSYDRAALRDPALYNFKTK